MPMPFTRAFMRGGPWQGRTGTSARMGRGAAVVQDGSWLGGRVRIGPRGVVLRLLQREPVIPADIAVDVIEIDSATALIYPGGKL